MPFQITFTTRFKKYYQRLIPIEKKQTQNKLTLMAENPNHPSLRTKRIKGTISLWESSITMAIRIIWFFEGDGLIYLLDIGHHDILEKY